MPSVIESLLRLTAERRILGKFENLVAGSFEKTSDVTGKYNCVSHTVYDYNLNWWPIGGGFAEKDRYWPKEAPRRRTIQAFQRALRTQGYEPCDDGSLEPGYEKAALYISEIPTSEDPLNAPTHVARQLPCGRWTSKLGGDIDIVHDTPQRLTGKEYGRLKMYFKRTRLVSITAAEESAGKGESAKPSGSHESQL